MNKCDAIACDPAPNSCFSNPCDCNRETGDFNAAIPIPDGEPCFFPSSPAMVAPFRSLPTWREKETDRQRETQKETQKDTKRMKKREEEKAKRK